MLFPEKAPFRQLFRENRGVCMCCVYICIHVHMHVCTVCMYVYTPSCIHVQDHKALSSITPVSLEQWDWALGL